MCRSQTLLSLCHVLHCDQGLEEIQLHVIVGMGNIYIYIIARVGGQYRRIFGSRLAVLAQPQGGPMQKPRIKHSPVLPDLKNAIIYLLYDLALASSINGLDSSSGRKRQCQSYVKPFQGGRLRFHWKKKLEVLSCCSLSVVSISFSRERTASNIS